MVAPAGTCVSCGQPLSWTFVGDQMYVRCAGCPDLFGTDFAHGIREGREAVMPDGRPIRTTSQIANSFAECEALNGG